MGALSQLLGEVKAGRDRVWWERGRRVKLGLKMESEVTPRRGDDQPRFESRALKIKELIARLTQDLFPLFRFDPA
jgi:hypothetical protein